LQRKLIKVAKTKYAINKIYMAIKTNRHFLVMLNLMAHKAKLIYFPISPQPDTSQSFKTRDIGLLYLVICTFTLEVSLVLIH